MRGLLAHQRHQHLDGLLGVREARIVWRRRGEKSQTVESAGFEVVGKLRMQLAHRGAVRLRTSHVVFARGVSVEGRDRLDVSALPLRLRALLHGCSSRRHATVETIARRAIPELVIQAHREAPLRHPARLVLLHNAEELLLRFLVTRTSGAAPRPARTPLARPESRRSGTIPCRAVRPHAAQRCVDAPGQMRVRRRSTSRAAAWQVCS